ncbi:putative ABC transport system ATP-binding protein [Alkalibacillus flavidus]|uniref:ABC transport system ATP-binding protein n=1 Tax=Alkalibacillus flavidus TaxID=546021 RepID=A0ABV2KXF6_9BACI
MTQSLFEFQQVSRLVLSDVSFSIEPRDRLIIFGPSGSGKSTLLHLFNRMDDPETGHVLLQGKPIEDYTITLLRKRVGLVMQQPYLFDGTVEDNLRFGPDLFEEWQSDEGKRLLELVNLPKEFLTKQVDELSGGEKQRVSLARTLANQPDVLLLDEPTSALDERNIEAVEQDLIHLIDQHRLTVVMVTHSIEQARRIGTKGLFLEDGQIAEIGNIEQLLDDPQSSSLQTFLDKS